MTVSTPSLEDGSPDLSYVQSVIDEIDASIPSHKTIIIKSAVPSRTNGEIYNMLPKRNLYLVQIVKTTVE
ncbi:hypothetical protein BKP45_18970 [Anaerobacillus alkalidiazotrophicus]|uniref:UDP-glucose/GDP-mannose dehydrogenase N-terminal domain-containing protein n=1 Tax=Anaerobacillus alkalidiazotrophicus TaxID=472963 RepID=A0A1S2M1E0_9BACI|nr:hypothetical protein BKP45_18970 [Anaerobacillus alkalidiazotrophicus]